MPLVVDLLFSASIAVVFVRGGIFSRLRNHGPALWRELSHCAMCVGVWVGGASQVLVCAHQTAPSSVLDWLDVAFVVLGRGALTGVLALAYVLVWDWLEKDA